MSNINNPNEGDEMSDVFQLRFTVEWFAIQMESKLRMHDRKKDGWDGDKTPNSYLLARLKQELSELQDALTDGEPGDIIEEAADVANFAMMIADRARNKIESLTKLRN